MHSHCHHILTCIHTCIHLHSLTLHSHLHDYPHDLLFNAIQEWMIQASFELLLLSWVRRSWSIDQLSSVINQPSRVAQWLEQVHCLGGQRLETLSNYVPMGCQGVESWTSKTTMMTPLSYGKNDDFHRPVWCIERPVWSAKLTSNPEIPKGSIGSNQLLSQFPNLTTYSTTFSLGTAF